MTPSSHVGNQQVVTVNWSGLVPTKFDPNSFPIPYDDEVAIYECTQTTTDGTWYYSRDCYTQPPPNYTNSSDGNMLDPTLGTQNLHAATGPSGSGEAGFQILVGTLHTNSFFARPAFDIQCDSTHPCVLKVVDLGKYFKAGYTVPNAVGAHQPGDWSDVVAHAVSVPISFAPTPACAPPSSTTPQVNVEGAPSASYALEAWSGQLCSASSPMDVNYAQLGENLARSDFETSATQVAVASSSTGSGTGNRSYVAAPADVSGVAIAFNMIDFKTGLPITTLRLTPRLVAMLVTDSAIYGADGFTAAAYYPMTTDPEFLALNPGYHFPEDPFNPGTFGVIEPILEGYQGDDTEILTRWIASDADARAFLSGHDTCGQVLNPNWKGVVYPTSIFNDLEQNTQFLPLSGYYNPITNLATEVADIFYGKAAGYLPPNLGVPNNMKPVDTQFNAMFGVFDATSAARSGEPTASLLPASTASTIANYVTESGGRCQPKSLSAFPGFVIPDAGGLSLGLGAMTVNADGTLNSPVSTTTPGAYPLTKVDYLIAPDRNLTPAAATAISDLIRFAGGKGQAPGVLPFGYSPLPSYLQADDAAAAAAVLKGVSSSSPPTTTGGAGAPPSPFSSGTGVPATATGSLGSPGTGGSPATTAVRAGAGGTGADSGGTNAGAGTVTPTGLVPIQAVQAPFKIFGLDQTDAWLFVSLIALAIGLALAGAILYWRLTPRTVFRRGGAPKAPS
jgi:hypothetical protein